ncbi:MAG: metallophosphoesterase [Bryobacterales bacterium]|nr:metallophosphoesterase [Bryobacterales bacterium]
MRIAVLLLAIVSLGWAAGPAVDFIQITDTHVVDLAEVHPALVKAREHFAKTGAAFERYLDGVAKPPRPAFLLHTGDIADAYCFDRAAGPAVCRGVEISKPILKRSPVPVYLTLGNHDIQAYRHEEGNPRLIADHSVAPRARAEWSKAAKSLRRGTYYSFRKRAGRTSYVFLVLDNGDRSLAKDSAFSAGQLAWLKKQVSANPKAALILVMHVPLGDDAYSGEIKSALADSDRVVLSIAGHRHSDAVEEIALGARRFTQVRTSAFGYGEGNWRRFRLLEDRIEIGAPGKPETQLTVPVSR